MAFIDILAPNFRHSQLGGGAVTTSTQDDVVRRSSPPAKVKGTWITFADGSRFRRATSYSRSTCWLEYGAANYTQHIRNSNGRLGYFDSGPGGWIVGGQLFSGGMTYFVGAPYIANLQLPPASIPSDMKSEAVTKALNNLANSKGDVGENLATLGQTIRMLQSPMQTLVNGLRHVRREQNFLPFLRMGLREIKRHGLYNTAAKEYLEYVYGWKPLMQDIHDLMSLAKTNAKAPLLVNGRGVSKRESSCNDFTYVSGTTETIVTTMPKVKQRVSASLWGQVDPNMTGVKALNQLGLLNPWSIAWDLVPWSFVVDWALPIGQVLSAITATVGLNFVNGSIGYKLTAGGSYTSTDIVPSGYTIQSQRSGGGNIGYQGYRRETFTTWPLPGLWFDPDPLRLQATNSDRVFKALALTLLNLKFGRE